MIDGGVPSGAPHPHVSGIENRTASIGITRFHVRSSYLEWDPRAAEIFDAGLDDRPALDIWRSRVHPADTHLLSELYSDASASIGAECIYRIILSDNQIRHILTRSVAIENGPDGLPSVLTGVVSIVEPPQRPEPPPVPSDLRTVLDNVSLGFAIIDSAMVVRYINAQTEHHLGIRREHIVGMHLHDALPALKGSYFDRVFDEVLTTRSEVVKQVEALFLPGKTMEVTANYVDGIVAISFRDITDVAATTARLLEAYRELLAKSRLDDLTGVLNRAALFDRIERISAETSPPSAVLFIDLDDFKAINDTYGHLAGDHVLRTIAGRLAATCDSTIVFGRIGGDEFVAALFDDTLLGRTRSPAVLANAMAAAVARPVRIVDTDVTVSISIGIAVSDGTHSIEDMLTRADVALYEIKSGVRRIGGIDRP